MWGCGLDRAGSGQGQVAGTCECGNETSGFIKCGVYLLASQEGLCSKKKVTFRIVTLQDMKQWVDRSGLVFIVNVIVLLLLCCCLRPFVLFVCGPG